MLRRTSRHGRLAMAAIVASFVGTSLLPLAVVVGGAAGPPRAEPALAETAPRNALSDRTPKVDGRGLKKFDEGRGQKPKQPLQTLDIDLDTAAPSAAAPDAPADVTAAPAPIDASSSGAPIATSQSPWLGMDQASAAAVCPPGQSCAVREPPDSMVAVGPDHVLQTVTTDIRFRSRDGTSLAPDLDAYEFFDIADFSFEGVPIGIDGISDVRWLYDVRHNRWLGSVMAWHCDDDGSAGPDDSYAFVLAALSTTGSPTGVYYYFSIRYPGGFLPVSPMIGTSADKITFAASEYVMPASQTCTTGLVKDTPSLITFAWANLELHSANPANHYSLWSPIPNTYEAPRPAIAPQSTANTIYGVMANNVTAGSSNVVHFRVTGSLSASVDTIAVSTVDLTTPDVVPAFLPPPTPVQPGGALPASVVDRYPTEAVWQDNILTFASTYPCSGQARACARVTQLNTTTPTPTRIQDMLVGTTNKDTWNPGVAESQNGTLHVVYTLSSSTEGMSSYDRYQLASDDVHTLSGAIELGDGSSTAYGGSRWGDFSGLAQDPRDTNAVWQANQYTKADGSWATRVSELQTAGSTFVPINPVRLLDSRFNNGLNGTFAANVPRTVDIAGRLGIPNDAVAITGNLTVVGQTEAGYAAATPLPTASPTISTLNFPRGDVRGNNLTSPLGPTGGLAIVYKASTGKTAHFVLDVTGYFLNDATGATYKRHDPARVLDTRPATNVGLLGPLASGTHYEIQVTGAGTPAVPAEAIAVTGNLAVVGQTSAGYVTLSTTQPGGTPPTATVNFPTGDVRSNGVTIKLSPTGTVWASYTTTLAGKSTHLVFDVTGYYVSDLTGARFVALSPGRRMDTRFAAPPEGLTGKFVHGTPRTLIVEPYQGIPVSATAITGNLTVVSQTRAGYVSMTPETPASLPPPVSTINFPVGDVRGNGITGPLSVPGNVVFTYTASAGATTHLILDVTGYFR